MPHSPHDSLLERLRTRIYCRPMKSGKDTFVLDLRPKEWGGLGQKTIRLKGHPSWPEHGIAVSTREQAEDLLPELAVWLEDKLPRTKPRRAGGVPTWREASEDLLASLEAQPNPPHNTISSYASALRKHVIPKWGDHRLDEVDAEAVGPWLDTLMVDKRRRHQGTFKVKAAANTKRGIRAAMSAVWRSKYRHKTSFLIGLKIEDEEKKLAYAEYRGAQVLGNKIVLPKTCYTTEELERILIHGAVGDFLGIISRPNITTAVPNTAEVIACQVGLATRIAELCHVRRGMIDWDDRSVYIPGTKTDSGPRTMLIFDSVAPWIERLRLHTDWSDPEAFVIRSNPKVSVHRPPAINTLQNRIARAQEAAGLKYEQENTHIFRDTASTSYLVDSLSEEQIKALIGHRRLASGATGNYLNSSVLVKMLPRNARSICMTHLPSPEQVYTSAWEIIRKEITDNKPELRHLLMEPPADWPLGSAGESRAWRQGLRLVR